MEAERFPLVLTVEWAVLLYNLHILGQIFSYHRVAEAYVSKSTSSLDRRKPPEYLTLDSIS